MLTEILRRIKNNKAEIIVLVVLLAIAGVSHGFNMFNYPYYENDEGTYMSQAWSLLAMGKLAPYTYWYDHAPAGWMLIALWVKLTGGFFAFGTSVNSGRVLMLILHLFSSVLLYFIAKRLSKSTYTGIIAVFIYSLSPLAIYFQRRVLLDNIMTFWVLLSLAFLLKKRSSLVSVIISSVSFGIAVLTKENAIFFAPAFLYVLYSKVAKSQKVFAIVNWLAISGLVISLYFLYALLKGELFPSGFFGGQSEHVSLLGTLKFQFGRGRGLPFWDKESDFMLNFMEWVNRDFLTIILGSISTLAAIALSLRHKSARVLSVFVMLFFIFLMRGKTVFDFYIVPIIPFLGLTIGLSVPVIAEYLEQYLKLPAKKILTVFTISVLFILLGISRNVFYLNETAPQVAAISWIKDNLKDDAFIAIDAYAYVDLHEERFTGDKKFKNAEWFWKINADPAIYQQKLENNWQNLEYLALSHEMLKQIKLSSEDSLVRAAFENSYQIADWTSGSNSYLDISKFISTNGDWMAMYKVKDKDQIILDNTWEFYKSNFINNYGQVVDPRNNQTTSEGQSYAMLRAVWAGDEEAFDGVYQWTKDHLEHRNEDRLFSWLWEGGSLKDSATASDADHDIALALLFAYRRFGNQKYYTDALGIINDIWRYEVVEVNGRALLKMGAGISEGENYLVNPSYFAPATYRIFAEADPFHDWDKLADDSYLWLTDIGNMNGNSISLPADWVNIDSKTGNAIPAANGPNYGFDAFRTMCRVAQDYLWHQNKNAYDYLAKTELFYRNQYEQNAQIFGIYALNGEAIVDYESISTTAGALCNFTVTNPPLAERLYKEKFLGSLQDEKYWGDANNYYDQNWAWFSSSLFTGNMKNLWKIGL